MMADPNYSDMSDEVLDAIINGVTPAAAVNPAIGPALNAAAQRKAAEPAPVDTSLGMSGLQLGLAGIGSDLTDIYQGLKEKGQMAFSPEGQAGQDLMTKIQADRAEREGINKQLFSNPEAQAGRFLGQAATAAASPARIPAQMALEGALSFARPGSEKPTSIGGELLNSLLRGSIGAGTMGAVGKGIQGVGKVAGAGMGRYTPEGEIAMRTKAAGERLGLPPTSLGQLYPTSPMASVEKALPGYGERVSGQAKELRNVLDRPLQLPEGEVPDVGRAYVDELAEAAQQRVNQGAQKYKAVDEHIAANNLGAFKPMYTARSITNTNNPGYEVASELLGRYGFDAAATKGAKASDLAKVDLSFDNFHTMRTAANKALNTLNRGIDTAERMGTSIPAENRAARKYLQDFKTALDSDAEAWAAKHAGNNEALNLYKDATKYYREVVAPTVLDNPIARKSMSHGRGFKTGQEGLSAATSNAGIPMVDRLYPTMSRRGQDMTDVLRNLPDVRATALSRDGQVPEMRGGLAQVLRAVTGHPVTAAETVASRIPGMRGLSESNTAARLVGAEDVLSGATPSTRSPLVALQQSGLQGLKARLAPHQGVLPRTAFGLGQYPQGALNERMRRLSATK